MVSPRRPLRHRPSRKRTRHSLSFAKTSSRSKVVDLPVLIQPQSQLVITVLLHLLRLVPFLVGGHRHLALHKEETPLRERRLKWWTMQDLNLRPPACEAGALPTELIVQA